MDCASRIRGELNIMEALHIQLMLEQQCFNRDVGQELPECWVVTLRALMKKLHTPPPHRRSGMVFPTESLFFF